mmetsp:Transcript_33514/g.96298  ORF Transcript_33514/g.96298 Transcript_33514/m.96298 type:complete len:231 (-) Transcript_33514:1297-1989(-)
MGICFRTWSRGAGPAGPEPPLLAPRPGGLRARVAGPGAEPLERDALQGSCLHGQRAVEGEPRAALRAGGSRKALRGRPLGGPAPRGGRARQRRADGRPDQRMHHPPRSQRRRPAPRHEHGPEAGGPGGAAAGGRREAAEAGGAGGEPEGRSVRSKPRRPFSTGTLPQFGVEKASERRRFCRTAPAVLLRILKRPAGRPAALKSGGELLERSGRTFSSRKPSPHRIEAKCQ